MDIQVTENPSAKMLAAHYLQLRHANLARQASSTFAAELYASLILEINQPKLFSAGAVLSISSGIMVIEAVWVQPELRRTGLGARLVQRAFELANERRCLRIVTTTIAYQGAQDFWRAQKFAIFARLPGRTNEEELIYLHRDLRPTT